MMMKKLALATLVAMGITTVAIAQQQPAPRSAQPPTQQPTQTPSTREATPAPRGGDRTEQASFETTDANGDGRVNRQEANDIEGFDFSRADTNNDAVLTRQEFMAAMTTSTPRDGAGSASARSGAAAGSQSRPGAEGNRSAANRSGATAQVTFDTADKNKDGRVSREEATDVKGLNFSSADVNDDAALSRQEFQTAMAGVQPRG
jgi:Ca2+-binding EF-hand superfamily protein